MSGEEDPCAEGLAPTSRLTRKSWFRRYVWQRLLGGLFGRGGADGAGAQDALEDALQDGLLTEDDFGEGEGYDYDDYYEGDAP